VVIPDATVAESKRAYESVADRLAPPIRIAGCWSLPLRLAATVIALCLLVTAFTVRAQPARDVHDANVEREYQSAIDEALYEYERSDWEEAAALFRRAHELIPSARTLRGLGLSAYEARRYRDAIRFLTESLSDSRRPLTAKQREEIVATLDRAKLFVGYLKLRIEPSTAPATLTINGQVAQPDPDGVLITDAGWLDVEVRAEAYEPFVRRIRILAGEHRDFQALLVPQQTTRKPTPDVGQLTAPARPPLAAAAPASSAHGNGLATWKWVSAATAFAALGSGVALLVAQKVQAPSYERQCVNNPSPESDCEQRRRELGPGGALWTGSITALSLGAALTALSVVLFELDVASPHEAVANNACDVGPGRVACEWHF
jgi:tetratricopeptide (TPR) repeat protein